MDSKASTATGRSKRKTVFIVHGRDALATSHLANYVKSLGLNVRLFRHVVARSKGPQIIANIVRNAIEESDAILVLFTPDEFAIRYDPHYRLFESAGGRWQARPNVIFEAGWAFGVQPSKTLFVGVGGVEFFTDIAGFFVTPLDTGEGLKQLRSQLGKILRVKLPEGRSEGFHDLAVGRPKFHDELSEIVSALRNTDIKRRRRSGLPVGTRAWSLLDLVKEVVAAHADWDWSKRTPRSLIRDIKSRHGKTVADESYWWLVSLGVFRFNTIKYWGNRWTDAVDNCAFAPRGLSLLAWIGLGADDGTLGGIGHLSYSAIRAASVTSSARREARPNKGSEPTRAKRALR